MEDHQKRPSPTKTRERERKRRVNNNNIQKMAIDKKNTKHIINKVTKQAMIIAEDHNPAECASSMIVSYIIFFNFCFVAV